MQATYLLPLTDFGFRHLFGSSHQVLISFINTFLPKTYQATQVLKVQVGFDGYSVFDSSSIIDVQCTNQQGEMFVVELLKAIANYGKHRSVTQFELPIYQSSLIPNKNTQLFVIGMLGFALKKDELRVDNIYCYNTRLNNHTEFITLNPYNFSKPLSELSNDIECWLYLLGNFPELDDMPSTFDEGFSQVFSLAELSHLNAEERWAYEQSLKNYRDIKNVLDTAYMEGYRRGLAKSRGLMQE